MSERRGKVANTGNGFAYEEPLLFERSQPGRQGYSLPALDVPAVDAAALLPEGAVRDDLPASPSSARWTWSGTSRGFRTWNASVDLGLYPLGSCTMKYNPKLNEQVARLPGFAGAHPLQPVDLQQGFLQLCHELERQLAELERHGRA